jgi:hypothetical protein
MRILPTGLTILSLVPLARAAFAGDTPPAPAALGETAAPGVGRDHSRPGAFFVNLTAGMGQVVTHASDATKDLTLTGFALGGALSLGATVAPNLVLFGQAGAYNAKDPKAELNGQSSETHDLQLTQVWIGPGVTYYLMPANVFFSAAVGVSRVAADLPKVVARSDLGPMLTLQVGKEWWISDRLALGVAAQGLVATMKDSVGDGTLTSRALTLGITVSQN